MRLPFFMFFDVALEGFERAVAVLLLMLNRLLVQT